MSLNGDVLTLAVFIASSVLMGGAMLYLGLKSRDEEDGSE